MEQPIDRGGAVTVRPAIAAALQKAGLDLSLTLGPLCYNLVTIPSTDGRNDRPSFFGGFDEDVSHLVEGLFDIGGVGLNHRLFVTTEKPEVVGADGAQISESHG